MNILFVDDEAHLLAAMRRFTRRRSGWDTAFVAGAAEAMEILASRPVDMVVTDLRMPGTDGVQLLRTLASTYPDVVRVVMSGYVDTDRGALAESLADGWLSKPCSLEQLVEAIEGAARRPAPTSHDPVAGRQGVEPHLTGPARWV